MLSFPLLVSFSIPLTEARHPFIPPKGFATGNVVMGRNYENIYSAT
jgi:hypothetical protein